MPRPEGVAEDDQCQCQGLGLGHERGQQRGIRGRHEVTQEHIIWQTGHIHDMHANEIYRVMAVSPTDYPACTCPSALQQLYHLDLSNNELSGTLPQEWSAWRQLRRLYLWCRQERAGVTCGANLSRNACAAALLSNFTPHECCWKLKQLQTVPFLVTLSIPHHACMPGSCLVVGQGQWDLISGPSMFKPGSTRIASSVALQNGIE